jgi:hypothetical protein
MVTIKYINNGEIKEAKVKNKIKIKNDVITNAYYKKKIFNFKYKVKIKNLSLDKIYDINTFLEIQKQVTCSYLDTCVDMYEDPKKYNYKIPPEELQLFSVVMLKDISTL